jgi:Polysaccharide deacetylase
VRRSWLILVPSVALAAAACGSVGALPASRYRRPETFVPTSPAPYGARFYAPGGAKTVALTFDDGPGKSTAAILAILARYRIPATFFNIGVNMAARPSLVRAEVNGGYATGNHTVSALPAIIQFFRAHDYRFVTL